ncbi:MAG: hypothetical protein HQM09_10615 [Candidatus Riflebacteria bacterium]|nr:hypothetical protein [Candidatus Riflebacteria bacterium]
MLQRLPSFHFLSPMEDQTHPWTAYTGKRSGHFAGSLVLAAVMILSSLPSVEAGALSWLSGKLSDRGENHAKSSISSNSSDSSASSEKVPSFFAGEPEADVTGRNLDLMKFVESHWVHARKNLEAVTNGIDSKIQMKKCSDITRKLFVIITQDARESLKTAGAGLTGLNQGNRVLDGLLNEISRIVTAPNQETLAGLEAALGRARAANDGQVRITRSYLAAADGLMGLGNESYSTLELIPTLSIGPLDLYVLGGKTLMKQIQSNAEAMKGLLLNVQNSCEQMAAGLEMMSTTLKSTLRFSDHFAYRQFPLVNLPVPSREKLFSQIGTLKNTMKGVDNTIEIGTSQTKNAAQQFSNLMENMTTKIRDTLQYQTAVDMASGNLPQISGYAQNQVNGLYQRTKESLSETRLAMAKGARSDGNSSTPPRIALESGAEASARAAQRTSSERLPLFLLGGKNAAPEKIAGNTSAGTSSSRESSDSSSAGKTMVLYSENEESIPSDGGLRPEEAAILQKELGGRMPYMELAKGSQSPASPRSPSKSSGSKRPRQIPVEAAPTPEATFGDSGDSFVAPSHGEDGIAEFLKSSDPMPAQASGRFGGVPEGTPSPAVPGDSQDVELMRMENGSGIAETSDLLPMLRLDDSTNAPESRGDR